jgi:hypothetical protein
VSGWEYLGTLVEALVVEAELGGGVVRLRRQDGPLDLNVSCGTSISPLTTSISPTVYTILSNKAVEHAASLQSPDLMHSVSSSGVLRCSEGYLGSGIMFGKRIDLCH